MDDSENRATGRANGDSNLELVESLQQHVQRCQSLIADLKAAVVYDKERVYSLARAGKSECPVCSVITFCR